MDRTRAIVPSVAFAPPPLVSAGPKTDDTGHLYPRRDTESASPYARPCAGGARRTLGTMGTLERAVRFVGGELDGEVRTIVGDDFWLSETGEGYVMSTPPREGDDPPVWEYTVSNP